MRPIWLSVLILISHSSSSVRAEDWSQFRGLNGGIVSNQRIPVEWDDHTHVRWCVSVPGYGWSSPITVGNRVYLTTAVSDQQNAPLRRGPGSGEKEPPKEVFRWQVHCFDADTGKSLWQQTAAERKPPIATHLSNTYASETPICDGERIYAYFGMIGVFCYDLAGELQWKTDLGSYRMQGNWGTSSSPALDGNRLFVQCDNHEHSFLVALDARNGDELWRVERPEPSTWSSPVVWRNRLRTELVVMGTRRIRSYDPATGKVLWELITLEGSSAGRRLAGGGKAASGGCKSTPVATPDMIYLGMASKIQGQPLGPMWAVKPGAVGDISLRDDETSNDYVAWFRADAGPHFSSAVVYDNLLYVFPAHGGRVFCFDALTGTDVYQQKIPGASDFMASPWAHDDKIYSVDASGTTFVVQAGRDFKLLAENRLDALTWSSPALAYNAIFLRTVDHLYRIDDRSDQKR